MTSKRYNVGEMTMTWTLGSASLIALAAAAPAAAQSTLPATQAVAFEIPAGPLGPALSAFARQGGVQLLYPSALADGRTTAGVSGRLNPEDALTRLLAGTGLIAREARAGVFIILDPAVSATAPSVTDVAEVVVTGSLLRGVSDGPSPVVSLSRRRIDDQGYATVAEALAALPQNFGGTANEGAVSAGADRTGANATYASGINLRGLGSDATLVLINGRRLAGVGSRGDFADLAGLPTSAIERVDVLLDGASALYGADAVGGVVNVRLQRDYEGLESRVRLGSADDGQAEEAMIGQTLGRRWQSGGYIVSYELYRRGALDAAARRQASEADHRPWGGLDRRTVFANPGNIVAAAADGGYTALFAIPENQDGTALQPADFRAGIANLGDPLAGVRILPEQRRHAVYAAINQDLGDRIQLNADLRFGRRTFETVAPPLSTVFTVTSAHPFFVSPTGGRSLNLAYSFVDDLPNPTSDGVAESLGLSAGGEIELFGDWRLDTYLAYSEETGRSTTRGLLNSTSLREALVGVPDNPATAYSAARDGVFNPFADGSNSSRAALDFLSAGFSDRHFDMAVTSFNALADGALVEATGGPLRLAIGLSHRRETYGRQTTNFTSGIAPNIGASVTAERDVSALFAEARWPIVGSPNARPGLERLELSFAARFEDYSDVGSTTSPKVGMIWSPGAGWLVRAGYGQSFRAPALREVNDAPSSSPSILPAGSQQILTMIRYGGNPDLEPETAETWSAGVEFAPPQLQGVRLSLNAYRIDFENRIGQPALENVLTALTDPTLAPFVRRLSVTDAADQAAIQALLDDPTTNLRDLFPASAYGAIVDARYVNTARLQVEGLDVGLDAGFSHGSHRFDVTGALSWMTRFEAAATPTAAPVSQLDLPGYPLGLRARSQASWSYGDWGAALSLNYTGDYADLDGRRIGSWLTTDLQLRLAPRTGGWSGASWALNIRNLFDRSPPFHDAPQGVAYDAANADVLGRTVSLQLTQRW